MGQAGTDKHKVVTVDNLNIVAHDALHAGTVLDKIQFIVVVDVQGIVKFVFMPVDEIKAVAIRQRSFFSKDFSHGKI